MIRGLASRGKSASEIADAIGSTAASVRVRCSQLKIKLKRRGHPSLLQMEQQGRIGEQKLFVCVPPAVYAALCWKAAQKQTSAAELSQMLLEVIVSGDLYEAVLDDDE
jgi:hypothetical protein